jgi:competence protein ComFC
MCEECAGKVRFSRPICPMCEKPSIDGFAHTKCRKKYGMDGLVSIWDYDGVVRRAIIALKYRYARDLETELISYIVTELQRKEILVPNNYCLTPIPMHWLRENSRGFNQSFELGRDVSKQMSWKFVPNLLMRTKLNTPQARLSGDERKVNIKGVFTLNPQYSSYVIHNSFILFDDVYTTGSTLKEATKVLKRKGAEKVWGLTVAK